MKKKKILVGLLAFILLIGVVFELYYIYQREKIDITISNHVKYVEPIDKTANLVDIYTPYYMNALSEEEHKEGENIFYYTIKGLKNKSIENKINKMIEDKISYYKGKYSHISSSIKANFENVLSVYFYFYDENDEGTHASYMFDGLNFDLTTGEEIGIFDVINDKNVLREAVQKKAYEQLSHYIGFVFGDGPCVDCASYKPDYSKIEDGLLSIMTSFNNDDYTFSFNDNDLTLNFNNVYVYNPQIDDIENIDDSKFAEHVVDKYDTNISLYFNLIDFIDNVTIYNVHKTDENIYTSEREKVRYKFISYQQKDEYYYDRYYEMSGKSTLEESDDTLIDYMSNYSGPIGHKEIPEKIHDKVVKESSNLKTNKFNIFNITGEENYYWISNNYTYIKYYVYHYSLNKDTFDKYRRQIYLDSYKRRNLWDGEYTYGYDYLKGYLDTKNYYYYIYDDEGNKISTKDIFNRDYDFTSIIPNEWITSSNYSTIDEMLDDAYIIIEDEDFNFPNHLTFYFTSSSKIYIKYKNQKITITEDWEEYNNIKKEMFK